MTAFNFPASPTLNQTYTANGRTYQWNGSIWAAVASAGGVTISDDTATNATRYIMFGSVTSGSSASMNVSSTKLTFNPSTGTVTATAVTGSSDESLKTGWRDLPSDFIEALASVKHGTYDRLDAPVTQDGVSAQSLQSVMPHSVVQGEDGLLAVNYGNAALVAAVKLAERVLALEARIAELEAK